MIQHRRVGNRKQSNKWRREFTAMIPVIWKDQYSVTRLRRFSWNRQIKAAVAEAQAIVNV